MFGLSRKTTQYGKSISTFVSDNSYSIALSLKDVVKKSQKSVVKQSK